MSRQINSQEYLHNRIDTINANALSELFSGYNEKKLLKVKTNKTEGLFLWIF